MTRLRKETPVLPGTPMMPDGDSGPARGRDAVFAVSRVVLSAMAGPVPQGAVHPGLLFGCPVATFHH